MLPKKSYWVDVAVAIQFVNNVVAVSAAPSVDGDAQRLDGFSPTCERLAFETDKVLRHGVQEF